MSLIDLLLLYLQIGSVIQILLIILMPKHYNDELNKVGFKKTLIYVVFDIILWPVFAKAFIKGIINRMGK